MADQEEQKQEEVKEETKPEGGDDAQIEPVQSQIQGEEAAKPEGEENQEGGEGNGGQEGGEGEGEEGKEGNEGENPQDGEGGEEEVVEEEEDIDPDLAEDLKRVGKKFTKASVEDIQKEIQDITKKIEHEKINLRIVTERYDKKYRTYCELQGKPVAQSKEEKEKEKIERAKEKKEHHVYDPIKRKKGKDKELAEEQEKTRKEMAKNQLHLEILTNDINGIILGNEDLKQQIQNLRKQKNIAIAQREAIKQSNQQKQEELDEINKKNEKSKGKIKTAELKKSVDTGKAQQKQFEENRDELEEEYHKLIEEFIKREREEKKEQAKKRQMLSMVSDTKALFKGANAKELERQIKLLAAEEISDRTPIIEEVVNKWKYINKFKKYMIEKYSKNAEMIKEAFNRMMEYTGVDSIEDLPIVFHKTEEQMSNIEMYITSLENDVTELEDKKKVVQEKIDFLAEKKKGNIEDKDKFNEEKKANIEELENAIKILEEDIAHKREIFKRIQPATDEYLTKLNGTYLSEYVNNKTNIDPNLPYNETSVNKFISNVEDYYKLIQMFDNAVNAKEVPEQDELEKLRNEMREKLEKFEKPKILNKNLTSSMKIDLKNGIDFDDIIKRSSEMVLNQINPSQSMQYSMTAPNNQTTSLNNTLNKTTKTQGQAQKTPEAA